MRKLFVVMAVLLLNGCVPPVPPTLVADAAEDAGQSEAVDYGEKDAKKSPTIQNAEKEIKHDYRAIDKDIKADDD